MRVTGITAVVGTCLGALLVAQQAQPPQQPPKLRSGVELVSLNVSVMSEGKYITDLEQEEFQVFEDGALQAVSFFSRKQQPVALAILLDTSDSMDDKLRTAQEAAAGFVKRLGPEDVAQVIGFNGQVEILQDFSNEAAILEAAIRRTIAEGPTGLYNAIYVSLKELRKIQPRTEEEIRRRAIVVLSDGDDTSSVVPYEEVLDLAKRSETAIYTIGLREEARLAGSRATFKESEFVLKQLAQETGGRSFFPTEVRELPKIYEQISQELSAMYTLAYTSKNPLRNGAWRRIVVRIARPGHVPRTRQGYYGPSAP